MAQRWIPRGDTFQNIRCAVAVLDAGTVNDKTDQQAKCVGGDVALAPFDPLASIIATNTNGLSL